LGALPHDERQREARLLAAREARGRLHHLVAAEIEAAEEVAKLLLAHARRDAAHVPQRAFLQAQLVHLVLREVAHAQALGRDGACPT